MFPIDIDKDIERLIKHAQENYGSLTEDELGMNAKIDAFAPYPKMLEYKLIVRHPKKDWIYNLTERGWNFTTFEDEKKKQLMERERLNLEMEQLRRQFFDYEKVSKQSQWAILIAALAALGTLVQVWLQWKGQ